eukprot:TRINITY_DN2410_c0_g2_i1.p1 TRINITY_DN2410_c0_g2~~TRINITY_DN2410_c0_g2_i1.p1  ORF type:complete len:361 (+),score=46.86 TRINITY_DN2410_c0_g2_i1:32-1114(+)
MATESQVIKDYVGQKTTQFVHDFKLAGSKAKYEDLLNLVEEFESSIKRITSDVMRTLPDDVLWVIISFCDVESRLSLSAARKRYHAVMNEIYWKKIATEYWLSLDATESIKKKFQWDITRLENAIEKTGLKWKGLIRNLSNPGGRGYSYKINVQNSMREIHFSKFSLERKPLESNISLVLTPFSFLFGRVTKGRARTKLELDGSFGIQSTFDSTITADYWEEGKSYGNQISDSKEVHYVGHENQGDGYSIGTATWNSGYSYTGKWNIELEQPIDFTEAIPPEIASCLSAKVCTRTITSEKMLPQILKGYVCASSRVHSKKNRRDREIWTTDECMCKKCQLPTRKRKREDESESQSENEEE